jgi:Bacterial HORMA domain family 1
MSYSYTQTETKTFTETHAKHIASKVATDLKRMQRFYGEPGDASISSYERELIELLKKGYLGTVTYGYKKNGDWIEPALRYTARELSGISSTDDDPGKITANANIEGASFYSFLTYSSAWDNLSQDEKDAFKKNLPFQRGYASEPGVNGYMSSDKSYSAGGKSVDRSTLKKY